mgnify:CR=1 FL=1
MRQITEIIIHCTATPEGRDVSLDDIRQWHRAHGFADIGYHYIIHLDGSVSKGRPLNQPGAHCVGHNANSIGIAYVGGLATDKKTPKDTRTERQKTSIRNLLRELLTQFPKAMVHGHREFANKACPCFDVKTQL